MFCNVFITLLSLSYQCCSVIIKVLQIGCWPTELRSIMRAFYATLEVLPRFTTIKEEDTALLFQEEVRW